MRARAEADLNAVRMRLVEFRRELLSAKHREKALDTRARLLRSAIVRKLAEEEALETTLVMAAKASGKHEVIS